MSSAGPGIQAQHRRFSSIDTLGHALAKASPLRPIKGSSSPLGDPPVLFEHSKNHLGALAWVTLKTSADEQVHELVSRLAQSPAEVTSFSFTVGEEWELPQSRYLADGCAELGGGLIPRDSFIVEVEDESRACGCDCGR